MTRSVPQKRMRCGHCKAEWWWTPGSRIDPRDHSRPDGRRCLKGGPPPEKESWKPNWKPL